MTFQSALRVFFSTTTYSTTKIAAASLLLAAAHQPASMAADLDWVSDEDLTEQQRATNKPGCCGSYIEPVRTDEDANTSPEKAPIRGSANDSKMVTKDDGGREITLQDDVVVTQGYRKIEADQAIIDEQKEQIHLNGNVTLREPGLLIKGDQADVDQANSTFSIKDSQYVIHESHIRGDAKEITRQKDLSLLLQEAAYTICPPDSNAWMLKGAMIKINAKRTQGIARNVTLRIKDVPVMYLPYLRFPVGNERQSGFLFPTIAITDNGINLAVPYYFNLAPNYDLTVTPNYLQGHGLLLENQFRHLNQHFETELNIGYLSNDNGGDDDDIERLINNGTLSEAEAKPFKGEDRWLIDLKQEGNIGPLKTGINYTEISDRNYFRDLDTTTSLASNSDVQLNQSAHVNYNLANWQLGARLQQYQLLTEGIEVPYKQLPLTTALGNYNWGDWQASLQHEWVSFDHTDDDNVNNELITGSRARINYQFTRPYSTEWGFFTPSVGLRYLSYQLNDRDILSSRDDSPSIASPFGVIDAGLFFERNSSLFDQPYIQTFEPRLFYFRSQHKDHSKLFDLTSGGSDIDFDTSDLTFSYDQLFRTTRFAGGDRIDDANQLSIGLTSRFINPINGREWFSASIGQIYHFADRRVNLLDAENTDNDSDIAARLSANINDHWRFNSDIIYNDDTDKISSGNIALRYRGERQQIFNFDYRYFRQDESVGNIEQISGSTIWPVIDDRWFLLAHASYDIERDRELDLLGGLEYNDCCYRVRFAARRWLDNDLLTVVDDDDLEYDRGIFLEFQLKGLGNIGQKLDSTLDTTIEGYTDWALRYQ